MIHLWFKKMRLKMMKILEADKIGSATSPLNLTKTVSVTDEHNAPRPGDVVVVRALSESVTYGNLELPNGRLAKINRNDVLLGVLGRRRALKGFVGDVPESVKTGDKLNLLNMGGVIGICKGHHSSLSDAIEVEVLGIAVSEPSAVADGLTSAYLTFYLKMIRRLFALRTHCNRDGLRSSPLREF